MRIGDLISCSFVASSGCAATKRVFLIGVKLLRCVLMNNRLRKIMGIILLEVFLFNMTNVL